MIWSRAGGRVVAGSNPVTPTGENEGVKRLLSSFLFSPYNKSTTFLSLQRFYNKQKQNG